jgi:hypothetical protein
LRITPSHPLVPVRWRCKTSPQYTNGEPVLKSPFNFCAFPEPGERDADLTLGGIA